MNEYEYNYHDLAHNADYIEEVDSDDEYYYDDGTDEPWCEQQPNEQSWDHYYHDLANDLIDD